ncbi:MAG: aconitate hydratase AcnA [Streptococcaceae bacterium]|nr:aconitate hydratase AcnA [Streptococcaceae bacterium]
MYQTKLLTSNGKNYQYFDIKDVAGERIFRLPYALRILLESLIRQYDGEDITAEHIQGLLSWVDLGPKGEVPFKPARVVLQDFTGVPTVVDLAAMRDAMKSLGGNTNAINPEVPVDLVIDHSVQVDAYASREALQFNSKREFERNYERYEFLKWAQESFDNFRVVPPATGIIHQVNIEYLSDVVTVKDSLVFPDTLVGTDSHTTMINGIGVLGWGVGGIEAEAGMLGEASYFPLPEVIGVRLIGSLPRSATATDLALKITQVLRTENVVGKFVEYFGDGLKTLSLADRATIANMAPEYGATCGYFPIDEETLSYMRLTGRDEEVIQLTEDYVKANHLFYDETNQAAYTKIVEIDLSSIETNLSGPKRPQDLIPLSQMKSAFHQALTAPAGNQGFGLDKSELEKSVTFEIKGQEAVLKTGDIGIAAITSCTNTSNPYVMMAAGLLARNAVKLGLTVKPTVKTSLAPGSKVVSAYLENAGVLESLDELGFDVVGYGCTTCIGNSGPLEVELEAAVKANDLLLTSVLSGNRNFEGRIHPLVKANYLASPPLVVAYAIAGNVGIDLVNEPLGHNQQGRAIYLKDVWPDDAEINQAVAEHVTPELFKEYYAKVFDANESWNEITTATSEVFNWQDDSTYIANPPYFDEMTIDLPEQASLDNLRVLAKLGDSVTTDHISPAGAIGIKSPAGEYLLEKNVQPKDFNSFGSRRGNHHVMMRGTFGNIRIRNQIATGTEGGYTTYLPTGEITSIYDAAMKYKADGTGLIILAGKDYGMGSSRDWAAKGANLLGVKAVIAESYERIHRSNLVMMGILPLQYLPEDNAKKLGLTGTESFSIQLPATFGLRDELSVQAVNAKGDVKVFKAILRFDAKADIRYYQNGGILPMVIRKKCALLAHEKKES